MGEKQDWPKVLDWEYCIAFFFFHGRCSSGSPALLSIRTLPMEESLSPQCSMSLGQAAPYITSFIRAKEAALPIFQMIERNRVSKNSMCGRKLCKLDGHIQFKKVTFNYPSRPDVLIFDNLSFEIPLGKILAVVGGSGSGKSTIITLIERFYKPLSGHILLDGTDIMELDLKVV
ncbi:hypothetical protein DH2020_046821 [Rehmannia glutinosa]|uniref:ABC transporter domain-containing protein n=1 Tax=Rehmannia glutinosa TaxID=99300 RepID=A0ABR0UA78_REHGL